MNLLDRVSIRDILELSDNPTPKEIKENYKRLMKKYHPDICKEEWAEEYCKRLNRAYEMCIKKAPVKVFSSGFRVVVTYRQTTQTNTTTAYSHDYYPYDGTQNK